MEQVDVLVAGAGYAGLSASMYLAQQGVSVLAAERHTGTSPHPKATGQTWRSMELFRFAGIDERVQEATLRQAGGVAITAAPGLGVPVVFQTRNEEEADVSAATPMPGSAAGQDAVEPIMAARAAELGADLRFGTEFASFEQDEKGITALIRRRDTGEETTVRARYLVAADGSRSPIRQRLGIGFEGTSGLQHLIGAVFDADLEEWLPHDEYHMYFLRNERFNGFLANTERRNRFVLGAGYDPAGVDDETIGAARIAELIRAATGFPGLEAEIVSIGTWEMAAQVATGFRSGRIFLVGDAAKVAPPSGGQGGATAIADGNNLAWKLAAVLREEAGDALLDTYEAERRPFAQAVVDMSMRNLDLVMEPQQDRFTQLTGPKGSVELILGFQYRSSAIRSEDDDTALTEDPLNPSGRPGFRAPDGDGLGIVDLIGRGWVLLARTGGWRAAARQCGIGHHVLPQLGDAYRQATLIRPDGMVAWRSDRPAGTAAVLGSVLGELLGRTPPAPNAGTPEPLEFPGAG